MKVELKNDNLRSFLNEWDEVLMEMSEHVDDGMLTTLFRTQVEKSSLMVPKLELYDWGRFESDGQAKA